MERHGIRPSAGVAMCVFNGGRYLEEQLRSIAAQTELPACVAIVDDGSTDGSWELLERWTVDAPFKVLLHRNPSNLGVVRNFEKASRLLLDEVDVVFFSDHDDIWSPGKVAAMLDIFAAHPETGLVHSDADLIDGEGRPLGRRLLASLLVTDREREQVAGGHAYRPYAKRNLVTGAACACRSEVVALAMPFSQHWIHDEWIAFTAAIASRVCMLEAPLMCYRLHATNTVGLPIPDTRWWIRTVLESVMAPQVPGQQRRLERLLELRTHTLRLDPPADALICLDRAIAHARHRAALPRGFFRRLAAVVRQWREGQYHEWSSGDLSMLHDLLVAT